MNSQTPAEKLSEIDRDMEIIRKKLHALNRIVHNPKADGKSVFNAERDTLIYMSMLTDLWVQKKYVLDEIGHTEKNINIE